MAVNPLDDSLYILDNSMVLKVTADQKIVVVAGRPLHCPPRNSTAAGGDDVTDDDDNNESTGEPIIAVDTILEYPQHISFAPNGDLYIVESNAKNVNRVRVVDTAGRLRHYAGVRSSRHSCNCRQPDCRCYGTARGGDQLATEMLLDTPTAIAVTPDGVLHVADMGNLRVHSIVTPEPTADRATGQYEVLDAPSREMYVFNRYGQHVATRDVVADRYIYNFTYHLQSYYGKLTKVTDGAGATLNIKRDYKQLAREIQAPGGQRCKLAIDAMGQLQSFISIDNSTIRFLYLGNTGLLESRETGDGHFYQYEYDAIGRLSAVIVPTGERVEVETGADKTGALVTVGDGGFSVTMSINGHRMLLTQGIPLLCLY